MDINETWDELVLAIARDDRKEMREYAEAAAQWANKGGFLPSGVERDVFWRVLAGVLNPYGDLRSLVAGR